MGEEKREMQEYIYGVDPYARNRISVQRVAVIKVTAKTVVVSEPGSVTSYRSRIPRAEVSWNAADAVAKWRNELNKEITDHTTRVSKLKGELELPVVNGWEKAGPDEQS